MTVTSLGEGWRSERGRWKKLEWKEVTGAWGGIERRRKTRERGVGLEL
jgi:hypothetical protein